MLFLFYKRTPNTLFSTTFFKKRIFIKFIPSIFTTTNRFNFYYYLLHGYYLHYFGHFLDIFNILYMCCLCSFVIISGPFLNHFWTFFGHFTYHFISPLFFNSSRPIPNAFDISSVFLIYSSLNVYVVPEPIPSFFR